MSDITLTLTRREAIVMHRAVEFWEHVLMDNLPHLADHIPEDCTVLPLESACMKLETAILVEDPSAASE